MPHILYAVPHDPEFIPPSHLAWKAFELFRNIVGEAESFDIFQDDHIAFFASLDDFELVKCPSCGALLSSDWWKEQMKAAFAGQGFELEDMELPCCGGRANLNELVYREHQCFGKFALTALNPPDLYFNPIDLMKLEALLVTRLSLVKSQF